MLTKASALSRLRYWLHLVQAPKYGPGFIAAERRGPSVRAGFTCSVQAIARRPPSISSFNRAALRDSTAGKVLLSAFEILHCGKTARRYVRVRRDARSCGSA